MSLSACSPVNQKHCPSQEESHECGTKGTGSQSNMAHELLMDKLEQGVHGDAKAFDRVSELLDDPESGLTADTPFNPKKDLNVKDTPALCMAYLNGDLEGVKTLGDLQQALAGSAQPDPSAAASAATAPFSPSPLNPNTLGANTPNGHSSIHPNQGSQLNVNQPPAALVDSKYANLVTPGALDAALPASIMPFPSAPQASTTAYDQGYNFVDNLGSSISGAAGAVKDDVTGAVTTAKDKTATAADNAINNVIY